MYLQYQFKTQKKRVSEEKDGRSDEVEKKTKLINIKQEYEEL